jgi:fatty-acyl-CoA synthase
VDTTPVTEQSAGRSDGPHSLGRWPTDRAQQAPEQLAVDDGGSQVSYRELDARASALAELLRRHHQPGDRIATLTGNSADHVVVFFACAKARLVLVPLSWRLSPRELTSQLAHAEPALLLVEAAFGELATAALVTLTTPPPTAALGRAGVESGVGMGERSLGDAPLLSAREPAGRFGVAPPTPPAGESGLDPVRDDDPLLLLYTSGTAGRPKGVVLTHANCFWTNLSLSRAVPIGPADTVLAVLPQFHVGGWNVQPLLAWWVGATVLLERTFDAGRALRLIAGRAVTTMMGVPANYLFLAEHPDFAATNLGSLRHAVVGGAPMPEPLLRSWHRRGVLLVQGYGLTEAAPNVLCLPGEQARQRVGFAGRPYPYVEVAVADAPAEGSAEGELLVRGPNVFAGYWRDPAATDRVLREGWLHTGDRVARDEQGYYRVLDRVDDMFVSGGENVSPSEVESVLHEHPAVAEAAVVGWPDERWGRVGVAFVVCRPACPATAAELIAHCRTALAGYKVPREIRLVSELPHSAVGKLLRRDLRADTRQEGIAR